MDKEQVKAILEAVLFAAGYPLSYEKLCAVCEISDDELKEILDEMKGEYEASERGIRLICFKEACQLCTKEQYADKIRMALGVKQGGNLSRSSLETLAIIAYHQPVTRSYIETVRGIDSTYAVNNLTDKKMIEVCGRLDAPGKPALFRTTDDFLRVFGISSIEELPSVELFATVELPKQEEEN